MSAGRVVAVRRKGASDVSSGVAVVGLAAVAFWFADRGGAWSNNDVCGQVFDHRGRPVSGATVLVILKTWREGGYRQKAFRE